MTANTNNAPTSPAQYAPRTVGAPTVASSDKIPQVWHAQAGARQTPLYIHAPQEMVPVDLKIKALVVDVRQVRCHRGNSYTRHGGGWAPAKTQSSVGNIVVRELATPETPAEYIGLVVAVSGYDPDINGIRDDDGHIIYKESSYSQCQGHMIALGAPPLMINQPAYAKRGG